MKSKLLSQRVVEGMLEKKALDIVVLDLSDIPNAFATFMVICTGSSDTQVQSIAESVQETIEKNGGTHPWHKEGTTNNQWVLLDYVDVVAHIFLKEKRTHYALEELWGDAKIQCINSKDDDNSMQKLSL